jgi:ketosteroid isomerase-like protein
MSNMTACATVLTAGLLLLLPAFALAQTRNAEASSANPVGVEQEIHALEKHFNDSRARADIGTLGSMLADDWTVVHGDGTINTKAEYLADLRSGARKFSGDVKEDEVTIRIHGDTAVAAGVSDSKVEYKGRPGGGPLRFTRVYVKRDGRWLMIVSHATRRQP